VTDFARSRPLLVDAGSVRCAVAADPAASPAGRRAGERDRPNGYEHLVPLFAERAGLPVGHPRRNQLREMLINGYLPVARHIAQKYGRRGENPEDIEQVAVVGLILSVDRFNPDRGVDFLSFAVPTISGEVLRYLRDRSTTIRVPRRIRELQGFVYDAAAALGQRHGRAARPSEIAQLLEVDVEDVLECLQAQQTVYCMSLDEPAWGEAGFGGCLRFTGALGQLEPEFDLIEHREALAPLLSELPGRERYILLLRFFGGLTQTEIAQKVGVSQMHVSRLLTRTLNRLRHQLTVEPAVPAHS
jgi:RNA polymerase sigma-B factor